MSTTPIESWNIDLAQVGPIYPFAGYEVIFAIAAFAGWIAFHIWQMRAEDRALKEQARKVRARFESGNTAQEQAGEP